MAKHVRVAESYGRKYQNGLPVKLEEYIYTALDGVDQERGSLETIEATVNNTRRAFAKMLNIFVERRMLRLEDVPDIVATGDNLAEAEGPPEGED